MKVSGRTLNRQGTIRVRLEWANEKLFVRVKKVRRYDFQCHA